MARLAYGAYLLLSSSVALRLVSGGAVDGAPVVARILGARHVAQAFTLDRAESRRWLLFGTAIDLLHALSMIGAAVLSKEHRRAASLDAALALGMGACGLRRVRHG